METAPKLLTYLHALQEKSVCNLTLWKKKYFFFAITLLTRWQYVKIYQICVCGTYNNLMKINPINLMSERLIGQSYVKTKNLLFFAWIVIFISQKHRNIHTHKEKLWCMEEKGGDSSHWGTVRQMVIQIKPWEIQYLWYVWLFACLLNICKLNFIYALVINLLLIFT